MRNHSDIMLLVYVCLVSIDSGLSKLWKHVHNYILHESYMYIYKIN